MTRNLKLQQLTAEIEALTQEDRFQLLRRVLTPEIELRLLADELSLRTTGHEPSQFEQDVDQTVDDVRRARAAQRTNVGPELR
jgi:hypothetical protein